MALAGGALIGASASLLYAFNGRTAGISGILGGLLRSGGGEGGWRGAFLVGMLLGGLLLRVFAPHVFGTRLAQTPLAVLLVGGLLVGAGTQLGNGCTSGHGICGLGRGSKRSALATAVFMAVAAAVVLVVGARWAGGA